MGHEFDAAAGAAARDEGIERAENGIDDDERAELLDAVHRCALMVPEFTTDDVWRLHGALQSGIGQGVGGVMVAARNRGWCEPMAKWIPSTRVACHRRPLRVWRSLVYVGSPS